MAHAERRLLMIAVLGILVLKLAVVLWAVPRFKGDIKPLYTIGHVDNYYSIAKNIENGNGYRFSPDTSLTLMREPGFPYLLAGVRHICDYFDDVDYQKVGVVLNVLFTSVCALLIYQLAKSLTPVPWVPLIAPILFMLHPGVMLSELRNGVEVPFTLLLVVFLLILGEALRARSVIGYVKAGIVLGIVSCVRSTALLFPSFLIIHGFIFDGGWRSIPRSAARAALIFGCALIVLSPWIVRNYQLVGKFIPTASVQGVAMHAGYYICAHEGGQKTFEELDDEAAEVRNRLAAEHGYRFKAYYYQYFYDPKDEVRFNNLLASQVVDEYEHAPSLFVKCASENVFNFWFRGKNSTATLANVGIQVPYLCLAIAGLFYGFRQMDRPTLGLLLLFVLYTVGVYVPIHAQARYSIPLVPILSILAAIPVARLLAFGARRAGAGGPLPAPPRPRDAR
jgi:hypothetical protein